MQLFEKIKGFVSRSEQSPNVKQFQKYLNRFLILLIVGIIIYQLIDIGWREVLTSLPTQPLFYVIFLFLYVSLPFTEIFIYKQVWSFKSLQGFKAFLIKRVYNEEVMGYSGEFYLLMWAREKLKLSGKAALKHIRDNSIISSLNANLLAVILVGYLIYGGHIQLSDIVGDVNTLYVTLGIFALILISVALIQFRKYIFELPAAKALKVWAIYFTRFIIHHALRVVQWMVVFPDVSVTIWLTFLAVIIVVNRLPFLPSKELIFVSAGIELSRMLDMATASVAAMLLVGSALTKITNLIIFVFISVKKELPKAENAEDVLDQGK